MVVMARSAGLPARLAVGYASGTYNISSKRFVVSEADAHSWPEIYFPQIGWVPFEPTAARATLEWSSASVPGSSPGAQALGGTSGARPTLPLSQAGLGLLAGLAGAGLFGLGWIAVDALRLGRLPDGAAAAEIYRRLIRSGRQLAVRRESGDTPYEFAASYRRRLDELTVTGSPLWKRMQASRRVEQLMQGIVRINFHPAGFKPNGTVRQWLALRWRLQGLRLLQIWRRFFTAKRGSPRSSS
jgi:hypothetical protein